MPRKMFLSYSHATGNSHQWPFYENTINPSKVFFTFSLISTSLMHLFSRHDHVPQDSHVTEFGHHIFSLKVNRLIYQNN